ncbi:hypothetical protein MUA02_17960 [Enterobacteriaceae bacterium H20N1]|uniref:Uncharacterized protein n=1 Tax=Dryocola boscaweniae TaxID=2925397 RepID=A0A9X2WAX4_9ENTR|nr:hypothetical protein [Dryocola boscaweniae]MCT4703741.1 hypothetical protein [Dryocola boscaweniae]MCT4716919.1 hypothetical protein [Dryocola boscaweniae]MCT4720909.1 hypothetical protein [Dryocola boscaweniae]
MALSAACLSSQKADPVGVQVRNLRRVHRIYHLRVLMSHLSGNKNRISACKQDRYLSGFVTGAPATFIIPAQFESNMTLSELFGAIMKKFQLYVGGVNDITYRYDIQKVGDVFSVSIFNVAKQKHIESGSKSMRHITSQDVIEECASHYRRQANSLKGFLGWLGLR